MNDEMGKGRVGVILGREVTPLTQELHGRLEANLSKADEDAITTALQKAVIAGAKAAGAETEISNWDLPWGDQWASQHGGA
jgi:hypothetical protein